MSCSDNNNYPMTKLDKKVSANFNLQKIDGTFVMLEELRGSYILVNFWATWCKPCVAELPYFIEFAQENENVELILVNLDMPSQVEKLVKPFLKRENIAQTVVHLNDPNSNFWINDIDSSWSGAIPATLIIRDEIKQFYEGSLNLADLNRIIKNE